MDERFDEGTFSGHVPLFPLPGPVLLPGGLLPLHVFEPRYRAMTQDVLEGEKLLGLALLLPGYEDATEGCPAIAPHVCLARVVLDQRLPDGRFNLVVVGLRRARVLGEDRSRAYRIARVELIPEESLPPEEEADEGRALAAFLEALPARRVRDAERLSSALLLLREEVPRSIPLGRALDLCADALTLGIAERRLLLATGSVRTRLEALVRLLDPTAAGTPATGLRPWPPRFSKN